MGLLNKFVKDGKGQGLVEYGLILALVSAVAVGALGGVGDKVSDTFDTVSDVEIHAKIEDEEYVPVATAAELASVANGDSQSDFGQGTKWEGKYSASPSGKYVLVQDIDLKGEEFNPIKSFSGTFDGAGHTIKNLTINRSGEDHVGLFKRIDSATIENIHLSNVAIHGRHNVGGLVGTGSRSKVINTSVDGNVEGGHNIGGLVGHILDGSSVHQSISSADVKGSDRRVGGLVGRSYNHSSITDSYSHKNKVVGWGHAGGLLGSNMMYSEVKGSFASSEVIANHSDAGGLIGANSHYSMINDSYSDSVVKGGLAGGGLVGIDRSGSIIHSYSSSYEVSGDNAGSLIGFSQKSYARKPSIIKSSYWLSDSKIVGGNEFGNSGLTVDDDIIENSRKVSLEELGAQSTYQGWDFNNVWEIGRGGYPTHR